MIACMFSRKNDYMQSRDNYCCIIKNKSILCNLKYAAAVDAPQ